jgi:hypothetical protein
MARIDLFRMPKRPWNSGRIIGAKPPLKLKHVCGMRQHLRTARKVRDLALFKCGLALKSRDQEGGGSIRTGLRG